MNSLGQNVIIRDIRVSELKMLEDFLYEAIFIPEGYDKPVPHDIIYQPELYSFIEDFGTQPDDHCLVAEVDGNLVGAVWCRIANNYGHVDNTTPNLAISIYKEYRSNGIGTRLMTTMLEKLKNMGYGKVSLSVQKANYALKMYLKTGFEIIDENDEEFIMMNYLKA